MARVVRRFLTGFLAFIVLGNLVILSLFGIARMFSSTPHPKLPGISQLRVVDEHLWRGDAPSREGYASLARRGVATIIDLRSEAPRADHRWFADLGLEHVWLPIRDGETPSGSQISRFLEVARGSEERVYAHFAAGVGRTGTLAAAYLVHQGKASPLEAVWENPSVGEIA